MKPRVVRPSDLEAPFPPLALELRRLRWRNRAWLAAFVLGGHFAMFGALTWLPGNWRALGIFALAASALPYSVLGSASLIGRVSALRESGAWLHWRMVPGCPSAVLGELCVGAMRRATLDWCIAWLAIVPGFLIPLMLLAPNGGKVAVGTFFFYMITTLAGCAVMAFAGPVAVSGFLAPESESEGVALRAQLRASPMDRQVWGGWDDWWDRPPGGFSSRSMAGFLGTAGLYFVLLPTAWFLILVVGVAIAVGVGSSLGAAAAILGGAGCAFAAWYLAAALNRRWLRWLDCRKMQ